MNHDQSPQSQAVEIENSVKCLGIVIDQNLTFCDHVEYMYRK